MKVHVDMSVCETHAQCVFAAPDVFALDPNDDLVYETTPGPQFRTAVEAAVRACPVQAITIIEG